jgi:hypothetical protein
MMRHVACFDKSVSALTLAAGHFVGASSDAWPKNSLQGLLNMQSEVDFCFFLKHCQPKIANRCFVRVS